MPRQKDLKRLVRTRMEKTGESYTAARARIVARGQDPDTEPAAAPAPEPERETLAEPTLAEMAGVATATLRERTGREWSEWTRKLDAAGVGASSHPEITDAVRRIDPELSGWWVQTVTVGYERIRGLRSVGQRRDGTFEANKSRTYPVPVERLYRACTEAAERRRWIVGVDPEERTATPHRSVRFGWPDGTAVDFWLVEAGEAKSRLQVQHRKLGDAAAIEETKAFWQECLDALAGLLSEDGSV